MMGFFFFFFSFFNQNRLDTCLRTMAISVHTGVGTSHVTKFNGRTIKSIKSTRCHIDVQEPFDWYALAKRAQDAGLKPDAVSTLKAKVTKAVEDQIEEIVTDSRLRQEGGRRLVALPGLGRALKV